MPSGQYNRNNGRKKRKRQVPRAVVAIYVVMIIIVLAICAVVFAITLKKTQPDSSGSSVPVISRPESSSPSSLQSISSTSSTESSSSTSSTESSSSDSSWSSVSSPQTDVSGSSSPEVVVPTYDPSFFEDDLFIGDSIFTGLYLYEFLDMENVAASIGYTPYKAMTSAFNKTYDGSAVDYAKMRDPKHIYIMLGSNTMAAGTDFDVIVEQYQTLLSRLREACPESEIVVISIPPVTKTSTSAAASGITNENIDYVNSKLKQISGIQYYDLNSQLKDENGYFRDDLAEADGLHFKGSTYKILLAGLQELEE